MVTLDTSVLVDLFLPVEEGRKVKRTMNVYAQQKKNRCSFHYYVIGRLSNLLISSTASSPFGVSSRM
jgi:hypothetical protein